MLGKGATYLGPGFPGVARRGQERLAPLQAQGPGVWSQETGVGAQLEEGTLSSICVLSVLLLPRSPSPYMHPKGSVRIWGGSSALGGAAPLAEGREFPAGAQAPGYRTPATGFLLALD